MYASVADLIIHRSKISPEITDVKDKQFRYQQLDIWSHCTASHLQKTGIAPGERVETKDSLPKSGAGKIFRCKLRDMELNRI